MLYVRVIRQRQRWRAFTTRTEHEADSAESRGDESGQRIQSTCAYVTAELCHVFARIGSVFRAQ